MLHGRVMPRPVIRAARTDDLDGVIVLWKTAAENADRPVDRRQSIGALLERDPEALILAFEDGEMVGTIIAGWDGWRAHLYRLAVRPDRRRRGVARALLDAAQRRLEALGATRLDAMVLNANEDGQQLWEQAGYAPQQQWTRWVRYVE